MANGKISISTGVPGNDQYFSTNSTLSVHSDIAVSIAVHPIIPIEVAKGGEEAVKSWLTEKLNPLAADCRVEVEIGPNLA